MDLSVTGPVPAQPFLAARDLLETEYDVDVPVVVRVETDPDERTRVAHYDDRHVLSMSARAATSAMARELALHEFAHVYRYEEAHPSHVLDTREAVFLALAGREVERSALAHCYQIANHCKDVYADDITLSVGPADKLVAFLESELARALADRPGDGPAVPVEPGTSRFAGPAGPRRGQRITPAADPQLTAVNAAFALALLERHDAVAPDHPIYDLAHAAAHDAPGVDLAAFKRRFADLADDPDESTHRRALADALGAYADAREATAGPAAD